MEANEKRGEKGEERRDQNVKEGRWKMKANENRSNGHSSIKTR